jgi:tripartite-type tricarboxylate transporter receptor subunit TctC
MDRMLKIKTWALGLLLLSSVQFGSSPEAGAQQQPDFKGKTVKIIVGTATGGGVDLWTRLIAQYLGKYLPGEPGVIVQNMPGGSSLVATNYVYNLAKPDGLTLERSRPESILIRSWAVIP